MLPVSFVLVIAGILLAWRAGSPVGHLVGVLVALVARVLLGIGQGLLTSARRDEREQRLDEAILGRPPARAAMTAVPERRAAPVPTAR